MTENQDRVKNFQNKTNPPGQHGKYLVSKAKCVNVLLLGRTQVGKSTIVETLLKPQAGTKSEGFSITSDAKLSTLILTDTNVEPNVAYQINIIDTPGLDEKRLDSNNRTNKQLLSLVSKCVQQNITWLDVVCLVTPASRTHLDDLDVLEVLTESLGERYKQITMMVLTHCDEYSDEECQKYIDNIKTHESSKVYADFCGLGIFRFGAINLKKMEVFPTDIRNTMTAFKMGKIEVMRNEIIKNIILCADTKINIDELKIIYDDIQKIQEAKIQQALNDNKCTIQ